MIYHIFNKSISNFTIYNDAFEYLRMLTAIQYYQSNPGKTSFSRFISLLEKEKTQIPTENKIVDVIAYCLMPTHFHFILNEQKEGGIASFTNNLLNSYTRYFNIKHNRKGPLWQGRSRRVLVKTDEQLLHLTRYIHLNPVTSYLVDNPGKWPYSSYDEYLKIPKDLQICKYADLIDMQPTIYMNFVTDRINYQRELAKIKDLLLE
ncbi:MAG: transposase [Candidatus Omnitrophica bacterium]|nr:transposase [Candidatus Omnitrophota bacterium]